MSKLRLGVIFGGQSSEYSVSLHSVASCLRQIHADNYDMTLIGINKNGHFYLYNGDVDSIEHDTWQSEETCVSCAWYGVCYGDPVAWVMADLFLIPAFVWLYKHLGKKLKQH